MPTITPSGGTFTNAIQVSITTVPTNAAVYYTLNGTNPDESSPLYTTPFLVGTAMEVRARAYRAGYNESSIASAGFAVGPPGVLEISPSNGIAFVAGNIGWSMEISYEKQPPASQIMMYYNYNKPAMTEMINRAGYGVEGMVTDSLTGLPVPAVVWLSDFYPVYTDPKVGDYHKYVLPGTYTIRVTANGFKSKTIINVTVPATGSVVTNFKLTPDPEWHAYKVISCQIPDNNFYDEGNTPASIGPPHSVCYSLGRLGFIPFDMGDTIRNAPGDDLKVISGGSMP